MSQERRKVLLYLRPDMSAPERFVDAKIEAHPNRIRGDVARTALLAGFALAEVDSRLPGILAASLADDTKAATIRALLASFLEVQPAAPAVAVTPYDEPPAKEQLPEPAPARAAEKPGNAAIMNFANNLPD